MSVPVAALGILLMLVGISLAVWSWIQKAKSRQGRVFHTTTVIR